MRKATSPRLLLGLGTAAVADADDFAQVANNLSDIADASTARTNLSAAKSGANSDITSLSGLTTALSVAQGGTGADTAEEATQNLSFLQAGTGAVERSVRAKLRDIVDARDFGAAFDNSTDDTTALQAAIDYLGGLGGGTILLPAGTSLISSTLDITYPNIWIVGRGLDGIHNSGTQGAEAATIIKWDGTDGGTMIHISSPSGASAHKLSGGGIQDVYLDAGAAGTPAGADYCVRVTSRDNGLYQRVLCAQPGDAGFWLDCVTGELADARDSQHNRFIQCWSRNTTDNVDGGLFWLDGHSETPATGVAANISLNYFESCGAIFTDGDAYRLGDSDHNFFVNCRAFRQPTGTGNGIVFEGNDNSSSLVARNNTFIGFTGGNSIVARGTDTYTNASFNNVFMMLDYSNDTPIPTLETGATCWVQSRSDGVNLSPLMIQAAIGPPTLRTGTNSQLLHETYGRMVNESLRIENSASDHIRLADPATDYLSVDSEWSIAATTGGDLKFLRISGTGNVVSGNGLLSIATTQGVGYGAGAGGTVTQLTSKATLVSLNRMSGLITTHDAELAAGASVTFRWNNSGMAATDVVILNHIDSEATANGGGTKGAYKLDVKCDDGEAYITLTNTTSGALSEAVAIRFAVVKGSAS